jgi:hypothetical protein
MDTDRHIVVCQATAALNGKIKSGRRGCISVRARQTQFAGTAGQVVVHSCDSEDSSFRGFINCQAHHIHASSSPSASQPYRPFPAPDPSPRATSQIIALCCPPPPASILISPLAEYPCHQPSPSLQNLADSDPTHQPSHNTALDPSVRHCPTSRHGLQHRILHCRHNFGNHTARERI